MAEWQKPMSKQLGRYGLVVRTSISDRMLWLSGKDEYIRYDAMAEW